MEKVNGILEKFTEIIFFILSAVMIFSIFTFTSFFDMPDIFLVDTRVQPFFQGWKRFNGTHTEIFDLPYQVDIEKNETLIIKNTLPTNFHFGDILAFKSFMQSVVVQVDGKTVYEVGTNPEKFLGRDFGIFWVFVEIEPEFADKEIEISLFSHRNPFHGYAPEVFIGSRTGLFTHIFNQKGLWNFLSCLILVTGILIILSFVFFGVNKRKNKGPFYLGVYIITMGSWLIGESEILQFITRNTYYVTRIPLLAILVCPISINLYIKETITIKKKLSVNIIATLTVINALICWLLEFFSILSITDLLIVSLGLISLTCIHYVAIFFIEAIVYKNERAQKEFMAISIFLVFLLIEIALFYINGQKKNSYFMLIGMSIYIVLMIYFQVDDYRKIKEIIKEKTFYEKMAYTDALTGAHNRARYNEHMKSIDNFEGITILQADTDRLKYINDNFSHFHGDQAIVQTYKVLNKHLENIAQVYRIGGDEFSAILQNVDREEINKIINQIRQDSEIINAKSEYDFSISIGVAEFDSAIDKNIYFTAIRADQQMYENKKRHRNTKPQKFPATNLDL